MQRPLQDQDLSYGRGQPSVGVLVGGVRLQWVSLWEWSAFGGCPCGSGQPSVGVLVGVVSLQWLYCGSGQPSVGVLWEWPAFSGYIVGVASLQWVYCGSGQPSVGVLWEWPALSGCIVGVASLQWVSLAKRRGEKKLGKGEGQAMSVGVNRTSVQSPPVGPREGAGGTGKGAKGGEGGEGG